VGLLQLPAEMMHKKTKQESQSIQVGHRQRIVWALSDVLIRSPVGMGQARGFCAGCLNR
jgi:hypothetical protein